MTARAVKVERCGVVDGTPVLVTEHAMRSAELFVCPTLPGWWLATGVGVTEAHILYVSAFDGSPVPPEAVARLRGHVLLALPYPEVQRAAADALEASGFVSDGGGGWALERRLPEVA
jgi:hypothetical protein